MHISYAQVGKKLTFHIPYMLWFVYCTMLHPALDTTYIIARNKLSWAERMSKEFDGTGAVSGNINPYSAGIDIVIMWRLWSSKSDVHRRQTKVDPSAVRVKNICNGRRSIT